MKAAPRAGWESALIGDELIHLLPGRAALRGSTGELLVSDVHLGKDEAFLQSGRALPRGATATELAKLSALLRSSGASRLTVLGDLTHHRLEADSETLRQLEQWLKEHAAFSPRLVLGNHDRHAQAEVEPLPIEVVPEPFTSSSVEYRHEPPTEPGQGAPWIAGHIHPGQVLATGTDSMRLPIFWQRATQGLVLPAFGTFTGLHLVKRTRTDTTFAAGDEAVVRLT